MKQFPGKSSKISLKTLLSPFDASSQQEISPVINRSRVRRARRIYRVKNLPGATTTITKSARTFSRKCNLCTKLISLIKSGSLMPFFPGPSAYAFFISRATPYLARRRHSLNAPHSATGTLETYKSRMTLMSRLNSYVTRPFFCFLTFHRRAEIAFFQFQCSV